MQTKELKRYIDSNGFTHVVVKENAQVRDYLCYPKGNDWNRSLYKIVKK